MERFSDASDVNLNATSLSAYLREIGRNRILTREEERSLFDRIGKGDRSANNELITANLKFVVSVCREFKNKGLPLTDLISEGNLGLIRAAQCFDCSRSCRFTTYAEWWIRQRILCALAEHSRFRAMPAGKTVNPRKRPAGEKEIREVRDALERLRDLEREVLRLQFGLGSARAMDLEEIGALLGITREKVRKIRDDAMDRLRRPARGTRKIEVKDSA